MIVVLRFVAAGDSLANIPGAPYAVGQPTRYVNRKFIPAGKATPSSNPAEESPHEVTLDTSKQADANRAARYKKMAARGDIWPADEATARECSVEFASLNFKDGRWARGVSASAQPAMSPAPAIADKPIEKRTSRKESD